MNSEMDRRDFLVDTSKVFALIALVPSAITILDGCTQFEASPETYKD